MRQQFEKMFEHIPGNYMDAAEVEKALGFTDGVIKQWIHRGQMPFPYLKIRSRTRIRKDALVDWLMRNEIDQTQTHAAPRQTASSAPAKRRGRPPKVRDLAREASYYAPA